MENKNQNKKLICLSIFYKHKKGGFNHRLYKLYQALAARNHIVHYIAVEEFPIKHPNIIKHILWIPHSEKENFLFWFFFILLTPFYCFWIAKKNSVNRIIIFSSFYAFVCSFAAILLRLKMVTFLRSDIIRESRYDKKPFFNLFLNYVFERIGLKLSCLVVPNSKSLKQNILNRNKNLNITVLPNNIEHGYRINQQEKNTIRQGYGLSDKHFIIITAAPLNHVKNIGFLIQAFFKVESDNARLIIIGEDLKNTGERDRLEQLSIDLGINTKTIFTGWLDNPRESIAASDLFVFPSLQEGCPNALLEALSCDITCLGSRIPEIIEILSYEELLFSLSSTSELSQKIRKALIDIKYREKISTLSNERKKAFIFDWKALAVNMIMQAGQPMQ
jgi:glycosyltransferase involved in cell wall biosynthesis